MTISTVGVGAAVTPTVLKTYISHYANHKPRRHKPTAHISYDEGLHLIRTFLKYASRHTVEDLQAFTAQWVPTPAWVRTENVSIPAEYVSKAAKAITDQLGEAGIQQVGGSQWWQWRPKEMELTADWIEMRTHYNELKKKGVKSRRIMLYVHGGAYYFGSVDEHRYQMQRHARKLQARVFAPRYRLAPQFPFPCGLHDCLAAYLFLLTLHESTEVVLAGDSAGGGLLVSMMCLLRDQGLPLPAGAILISPWVDLTHSFPSLVGSDELDYIPSHGFMHKPSMSWPPPNDHELALISAMVQGQDVPANIIKAAASAELHSGYSEHKLSGHPEGDREESPEASVPIKRDGEVRSGSQHYLSVELDGKRVTLKDQIQMYTTNQLLAHPLVSPVLQPSLGGLPPVLILTGGGELLRDEQIYLAHKMASPSAYPLGSEYRSRYDPGDAMLKKYRPTPVQLQVWDDLCHVATTLSFTRPAKFMYRSVAQFGAWALARAQRRAIEIVDDDNISIISSESESDPQAKGEAEAESSDDNLPKLQLNPSAVTGSVGRAGDPLPRFVGNMIRERVDLHGRTHPLADIHDLPALQLGPDEVGVVKPGPVRKWLEARKDWDTKYSSASSKVRKERIKALATGEIKGFEGGDNPPPSALAARRTDMDILVKKRKRKSFGLAMWSNWGSRHDESTMRREQEAVKAEKSNQTADDVDRAGSQALDEADGQVSLTPAAAHRPTSRQSRLRSFSASRNRSTSTKRRPSESKVQGRRRTISVTDAGQTEGSQTPPDLSIRQTTSATTTHDDLRLAPGQSPAIPTSPLPPHDAQLQSPDAALLSSGFLPRFKTASHLRDESGSRTLSDVASNRTGRSGLTSDNASTRAVFAAHGVSKNMDERHDDEQGKSRISDHLATTSRPGSPLGLESRGFASDTASVSAESEDETTNERTGAKGSVPKNSRPRQDADNTPASTISPGPGPAPAPGHLGSDSPRSQRSLERLQSHQHDEGMGRMQPLRSLSSTAVVRADGIVGVVDDDDDDDDVDPTGAGGGGGVLNGGGPDSRVGVDERDMNGKPQPSTTKANPAETETETDSGRPKLYDRADTTFRTAVERMS
ncbi:hypothetical protein A1O1_04402 [Capronia coronata CBS 617.96]|uniref:Alpha/beta hydrolase fold-3 domain-containing protein n=1 Tax=Capronia coronata CBS 617.96 TaxID=1182541 RepID=W9YEJ0_9EURO|nr:uncharacterized protein A1O1_04402 [Capronia coronata CBS 617.96]EXJ91292.1 hypothetical protein A1O1_04402 [Capronia coronata CBS 617.96]